MAKCNKVLFNIDQSADTTAEEKATARNNIGAASADNIDADSVKVDGTDVKTKQSAKGNPDVSGGSATIFVDSITQNENGEIFATRRAMKLYTGTGSNTDAPMTQKAVSDELAAKAPINSPTLTGTPAAPTATASTDSTQIATTAFVHDAIYNDLKKAADVAGMENDDTHAYSGKAVSMAISSAVSGNADVFIATYSTQSSGTTLSELVTAYNAKKKIYLQMGGLVYPGGADTYEKLIPLTYIEAYPEGNETVISGFFFSDYQDARLNAANAGSTTTFRRNNDGWSYFSTTVKYSETAGTANEATNAGGYIEGGAIATNLAAKMNTNANNAAIGALQNLTGQLIAMPANTSLHDTTEIFSSYTFGFNTEGHVNEPYKLTLGHLWSIYIAQKTESVYARKPLIKVLDDPEYYQNGGAVNFVTVSSNGTNPSMPGNYQILCHRRNSPGWWGICQVPNGYDSNPYCEIDFDVSLTSYESDNTTPYAPMIDGKYPIPYIIEFCATFINASGNTPGGNIAYNDEHKFAVTTISAGVMLGDTQTFAHVRMEGYLQVAPDTNYAVLIGARGGNGQIGEGCNFHIKTNTVRVIMHPHKITLN